MKRIHRKILLLCCAGFALIVYFFMFDQDDQLKIYFQVTNFSSVATPLERLTKGRFLVKKNRKLKTILLYTSHFYSDVWKGLDPSDLSNYLKLAKCRIKECIVTYDKDLISTADVVVFHGVDFTYKNYTSKHFHALSRSRRSYQRWVFWMHETPLYYPLANDYNGLFNWTMTFSQRSDLYHPYYSYTRLSDVDEQPGKYVNYAAGKSKKVVWMVSHCGMTRSDYAVELQKYTDVTVYGLCGADFDNMGGICSYTESECVKELQQYKFYLSFENSFCEDYVTEKYYKFGLLYGLVPIVMGANYDDMNTIPGSYLDVSKFPSVESLGNYINYLDVHDSAYNKYFEWKRYFKVTDGLDKICMLCHAAHDLNRGQQTYNNFASFWSIQNLCDPYENVRMKLVKQIELSKKNTPKRSNN